MGQLVQWNDDLSVGIQEIDEQHKILVDLINELHTAIHEHHGSSVTGEVLNRIVEYTRIHFTVEESLMRIFHYPDYENHKHQHEALIGRVVELQEKMALGKVSISFELLHFLKGWLTKHIIESDKQYSPFLLEQGVNPSWAHNSDSWIRRLFG